jgi:hypothetical protein
MSAANRWPHIFPRNRERAHLSVLMAHSAVSSYSSDTGEMLFQLHALFLVSSLIERTVFVLTFI